MQSMAKMKLDLINKLRFSNPWKYKAPLLICWPYMLLAFTKTPPIDAIFFISLSYCTLFGIAGLGYLINDWADIKSDLKAGKSNKVGELKPALRIIILIILLVFAFAPWVWLPTNIYSYGLILLEVLLFLMYSLPPFRLKERGIFGVLTDSLYAYVIPSTLASLTFYLVGNGNYFEIKYFLIVINVWLLLVGLRGILLHQIQDHSNDKNAGVKTFAIQKGIPFAERLVRSLLPIEIILFTGFFVFVMEDFYLLFPAYILFILIRYFKERQNKQQVSLANYRRLSYRFLDDYYLDYLPIIILLQLVIINSHYMVILAIHLLLFRSFLKSLLQSLFFTR
jgi:4-hydroxybenzoate polyprenyltransferase